MPYSIFVIIDVSEERTAIFRVEISLVSRQKAVASAVYFSTLQMEVVNCWETWVNYKTTRRYVPEDSTLHSCRRENNKFFTK
jgi:hypothetical protein